MKRYTVIEDWTQSYETPIQLKKEERVTIDLSVKDSDPEWANWVWCITDQGMTGWVPTQILNVCEVHSEEKQTAIVMEDYSAYELSVNRGDILLGSKCLNGWLWCRKENSTQQGWVPVRNVSPDFL